MTTIAYKGVEWGENYPERTRDEMVRLLELAGQGRPDLVCLPEWCNVVGVPFPAGGKPTDWAETIPGPTTERLAEVARKYSMYIVVPIPQIDGDKYYNSAAFIDRSGELMGTYHKYQPTVSDMGRGTLPGIDAEVFESDFGKVGAAICFDLKFVEIGQKLADNGARLVLFPSAFVGGERILHWCRYVGFYVASSCPQRSYIADMSGSRFLAETGYDIEEVASGAVPPITSAVINMDREFFHIGPNLAQLKACTEKYGMGVEWEICRPEAHFTLASNMDDVSIEDIIEEFGFETWNDYLARSRKSRQDVLDRMEQADTEN